MTTMNTVYTGELRTQATHEVSGVTIITDAPIDNQGKGASFSPTDLMAASLGSCMLTIMGIEARDRGFNIDGTRITVVKKMAANPRRVHTIRITLNFPDIQYTQEQKEMLRHIGHTCPVALSLHPDVRQELDFHFFGDDQ